MNKKNIETILFEYQSSEGMIENLKQFRDNYDREIPDDFRIIEDAKSYVSVFYLSGIRTANQCGTVDEFAKTLSLSEEDAYRYLSLSVIYKKIFQALPYPEAFGVSDDGIIKVVIYKKTQHDVNFLMNKYCYELDSEELFEDRNGEPVVILKYKLVIKKTEEHSG